MHTMRTGPTNLQGGAGPAWSGLERLAHTAMATVLRHPVLFWTCIAANLFGAVFGGLYWYGPMLRAAPFWAIPFIPDCPLAAFGACGVLLGLWANQRWPFLNALVAVACLKYGLWTVAFWVREWSGSGAVYPIEVLLFVAHLGLFVEGLVFVAFIHPLTLPGRLAVIGWFVLSIVVDYGLGFHPPLGRTVTPAFAGSIAAGLTAVLGLGLLLLPYRHPAPPDAA